MLKWRVDYAKKVGGTMSLATTYAVVDIETTGTSIDGTNRMIQFSCVFVKNGQIINHFNTMVNPLMPIPKEVQHLTGITNKDVKKAPLFEDVAGTIFALLQGTTFVAHNINFDYRFLNAELERVGYPPCELQGIDTVQLSQILLPTLPSFKLSYLSEYLNLSHLHPHHADSDADATAQLLIFLLKRINNLPLRCLELIASFQNSLLMQTRLCFKESLTKRRHMPNTLPAHLQEIGGIVLRRFELTARAQQEGRYPRDEAAKKQLFANVLEWRPAQIEMMDYVHSLFQEKDKSRLVLEAPTGLGKTLGYLIPAAYTANAGGTVVISTATTVLQTQMQEQVLPLLQQILPFEITAAVLKGSQHYIDLEKFSWSLHQPQGKQTRLLQLRLLVWLTITKTGDLSELHLTKYQNPLFDEIRHHGLESLEPGSVFHDYDFVRRQRTYQANADLLITNHSYLLNHVEILSGSRNNLIIDEAQHLSSRALATNRAEIDFDELKILCDSLLVKIASRISFAFAQLEEQQFLTNAENREIAGNIRLIDQRIPELRNKLIQRFVPKNSIKQEFFESIVPVKRLRGFIKENYGSISYVTKAFANIDQEYQKLLQRFEQFKSADRLDKKAILFLNEFFELLRKLVACRQRWLRLRLDDLEKQEDETVVWLSLPLDHPNAHLRLQFGLLRVTNFLRPYIYEHFQHVLFVGASLLLPDDTEYTLDQLDLPHDTKVVQLPGAFDYHEQSLALIAADAPDVTYDLNEYVAYLAETLKNIVLNSNRQTLILFNSLAMIEKIYQLLSDAGVTLQREILAQGITGSNAKIMKHFRLSKDAVLLGAGTFWEGVDLPKDRLELLVITRLPFQAPNTLINRVKYHKLSLEGQDPFQNIALPEAMMRLKQGLGRLIRTPTDRGVVILLDSRVVTKTYGEQMKKVFPTTMPLKIIKSDEIRKQLLNFWEKR
ncbi:ATP-dependent helicase DinG [Liquorilactobacillus sucicola DSM 21376 = JCM 15457]|uniref:3'-5' exonuclease DinG n=1 Tax=Liquorilactobacillus sucicola DSM 21376 = JCM 15457 TaxID=1423806 RepID=A0A0R2DWR4_9LACO|nr:helicase C-terminal domain-containing protein [Liquorilactobacillus sucicola]KRN06197.1 ATP-dependent helicase DinG [Liquorilactobacillus sucicola DSM 21376 = JCM 15457]